MDKYLDFLEYIRENFVDPMGRLECSDEETEFEETPESIVREYMYVRGIEE